MKDKSSYRHYRLVTVKIKLGLINSFRPVYAVSPGCSLLLYFPCLSEKSHFYFCCNNGDRKFNLFFFFLKIFIYLAVLGLSCSTWDL